MPASAESASPLDHLVHALNLFARTPSCVPSRSCQDANFRIRIASGSSYVLKVANARTPLAAVDLQNRALQHMTAFFQQETTAQASVAAAAVEASGPINTLQQGALPQQQVLAVPQPLLRPGGGGQGGSAQDGALLQGNEYIASTELPATAEGNGGSSYCKPQLHWVTALSFVEGTVLSDFSHLGEAELHDVGRCAGSFVQVQRASGGAYKKVLYRYVLR